MHSKEPSCLYMIIGIATLGWLGFAWDAYMKISVYGAILSVFAGISFIHLARENATEKNFPWLFGWNDEPSTLALRLPIYASLFIGPATNYLVQFIAPEFFSVRKAYAAVLVVSIIVAFVTWIFFAPASSKKI